MRVLPVETELHLVFKDDEFDLLLGGKYRRKVGVGDHWIGIVEAHQELPVFVDFEPLVEENLKQVLHIGLADIQFWKRAHFLAAGRTFVINGVGIELDAVHQVNYFLLHGFILLLQVDYGHLVQLVLQVFSDLLAFLRRQSAVECPRNEFAKNLVWKI